MQMKLLADSKLLLRQRVTWTEKYNCAHSDFALNDSFITDKKRTPNLYKCLSSAKTN